MDLSINKNELLHILSISSSVVEKKNTQPILANVLLEADENNLKVSATDLRVLCS